MAKRSRQPRRQDSERVVRPVVPAAPAPESIKPAAAPVSKKVAVDFGQEYFHVYQELRNVLFITILMFVLMAVLALAV